MTIKTALTLLALTAATPALAQSNPALSTTDADGNDIVVTASRSGEGVRVRDLPASITLLTDADLAERQTRIVSDILRDVPGIAVSRAGNVGGLTQVRLRGSEANHVLVLIDGIEVADAAQGEFDFGTLIADEAARIEVLRGQQSSLYGSDAIGGVIQYITLTGREAPGLSVRAEGGSFGTFSGGARAAGVAGDLDYALSTSVFTTDGTPTARFGTRDIGATSIGATGKLVWTPSAAFRLTGVGRYSHSDAQGNNDGVTPLSPFRIIVDSPGVESRTESFYGLVRGDLSLLDGRWTSALSAQVADTTRRGFDAQRLNNGTEGRRYKAAAESTLRFGSDRAVNRLTGAVDYEREEFRNLFPGAFAGRRATENWGFVGQYELVLDDALSLGGSIRHDANDRFADVTTWRAQAGYRLPFGLRVRGAYGTGVKNPTYFELFGFIDGRFVGNPDLRPEKSKGWEAGVDQEFAGGRATVGATYFDSRLRDEVFTTFPAPSFVQTPANRTTVSTQRGVELFASGRPVDQIKFDLAYTWLRARENGLEEVRRPRHTGSVNTTVFSTDRRFSSTLTVRYNGRMVDTAFTPGFRSTRVALQEFVLVNLAAQYALTDGLSLFGRVENLFDEEYEELFGFATPGRAAYGGVRARF